MGAKITITCLWYSLMNQSHNLLNPKSSEDQKELPSPAEKPRNVGSAYL